MLASRALCRRTVLAGIVPLLAGCVGNGDPDTDEDDESGSSRYTGPMVGETELASDFPMALRDPETGEEAAEVHWHGDGRGEWHFQPLEIPLDGSRTFALSVVDANYEPIDLAETGYEVAYVPPAGEGEPIVDANVAGAELTVQGRAAGSTEIRFDVRGPDGGSWTTPPLSVQVAGES